MSLVLHYWAELQSVHGLRCYGNIARTRNVSVCSYSLYTCYFGDFLGPAFPTSHVQHISDMHFKFALRPHHVWKGSRPMVDIISATVEIRLGKNKTEQKYRTKI